MSNAQRLFIALAAARDLPSGAAAPDWVHLLPAAQGEIRTFDGRGPYRMTDAQAVIDASLQADARNQSLGLIIDENHAADLSAPRGGPSPARGHITAMEARPDGVWGRVQWTGTGRQLVEEGAYRGISPVIRHNAKGEVQAVLRASLVNFPNLRGLAALHMETQMEFLKKLADALGLGADATEEQVLAAVTGNKVKAADDLPALQSSIRELGLALGVEGDAPAMIAAAKALKGGAGSVVALQAELAGVTSKLNAITEERARERATGFVDGAIKEGRVGLKPMRDHYITRHMSGDATAVEKEIAAMPVLNASVLTTQPPGAEGHVSIHADEATAARLLGIDPTEYAAFKAKEEK